MLDALLLAVQNNNAIHLWTSWTRRHPQDAWSRYLTIPLYICAASFFTLLIDVILSRRKTSEPAKRHVNGRASSETESRWKLARIFARDDLAILVFNVVRFLNGIALVALSFLEFHRVLVERDEKKAAGAIFLAFVYATSLSFIVVLKPRISRISQHVTIILVAAFSVYFMRDIVLLFSYDLSPVDHRALHWTLVIILAVNAVAIPVITPQIYKPFNPSDPMPANPEQTASPLAWLFIGYLDHTVWKAYKAPHLPLNELPPLSDYDHSKNLFIKSFPHLVPEIGTRELSSKHPHATAKHRHIFLSLFAIFRKEYTIMTILLILQGFTIFLSPYGLRGLLIYLETRDSGVEPTVRPWVWILVLFLAPLGSSLLAQQYQYFIARIKVQIESIFTQLLLDHSLRIRVVASTGNDNTPTTAATSKAPSISGVPSSEGEAESSDASTVAPEASTSSAADTIVKDEASKTAKSLVGRLNNLISTDLQNIGNATEFLQILFGGAVVLGSIVFLYEILGWSAIAGFGVMLVQLPLQIVCANLLERVSREVSKRSDERVESVTETMSVIRMVKMFGWEKRMSDRIHVKREEELLWVWWNRFYELVTMSFRFIIPSVTMVATYAVYALVMRRTLDAATVFSSMAVFNLMRGRIFMMFHYIPITIKGKVSLERIAAFLNTTELLDEFSVASEETTAILRSQEDVSDKIGFNAATFAWSDEDASNGANTPSKSRFRFRADEEVIFKRGCVNLIIGSTGSGKTSLLMALLGEMHFIPSGPDSWYSLPREGGIAYAAQESWVMNATIKENILFGSPFDEDRYAQVIYQCGLTRDLSLFASGDNQEIGERGLTLSGGQKARITLARAVYSSAEILLLDDVFAALDVHTAKWIVEKCFRGNLIKGRTVLLVTHNVSIAGPIAGFVVSIGNDGRVLTQGTISDALARNSKLKAAVALEAAADEKAEQEIDPVDDSRKEADGKLIVEEEVGEGHISWTSIKMYLVALGGRYWMIFWIAFCSATFFECGIEVLQPWVLGLWATQYETHSPEEVNVLYYLSIYIALVLLMMMVYCCAQLTYYLGALRASQSLHNRLMKSILSTTMRWLDKTPTSRVLARCTQDVAGIDNTIPEILSSLFELGVVLTARFCAVCVYAPVFAWFGLAIGLISAAVGNVYMKAQLAVKREMSKAKAPVMAHFGAAIEGIVSIRAYGAQASIKSQTIVKIDSYTRASRVFNDLSRWIAIRIDILGGLFGAALGIYFVYGNPNINASNTAFTLTMAVGVGQLVLAVVQLFNQFEVNGNSLERLQEYMVIEQEKEWEENAIPPAYWPASGELRVENLTARYSPDGPKVLHNISFNVTAGERVGIVGRTGSGKSSLTLALLRCIFTDGEVYFDGLPISSVNLDSLRSHITIIPQMPELLSGTLRQNLDPFEQHDDAVLHLALRSAGLYSLQTDEDTSKITLDSAMSRGGSNLSVGERQIIALARAMVRESKLLILDEATSAIDYKTDSLIQESLRNELGKDVTVITVAHRLQTIMDSDKIMVLDAGKIVEFAHPRVLLQNKSGFLRALVEESGDKEALYAAADRKV